MVNRWATGDQFGMPFPADTEALRDGGTRFLTEAFRATGALDGNSVSRITELHEVSGGSTGRKVVLSVEYDTAAPGLHTDLFVKFSRDFDNAIRDRGKTQMESEVRFASLSRVAEFPIAVPRVMFGDYHAQTGTGILITERITFGGNGIERQYHKCLDYEMPEPLGALSCAAHRPRPLGRRSPIRPPPSRPDRIFPAGRAGRHGGRPRDRRAATSWTCG